MRAYPGIQLPVYHFQADLISWDSLYKWKPIY